ncbi:MAG: ATP-binding cassette domain-containing protein [Gemmatimonadetes bacterium]|nr:ATP-binding cassette domain-containing protein [Gemmatimonadota bacterium]
MIALRQVGLEEQGRRILADVDFEIERGEFAFLLGPTGSGKSTILQLILFERRPTSGVVIVGDYDSESIRDRDMPALRRSVSMVSQNHRLLQDRTVYENVAFAMEVTGTPRPAVRRRTHTLLADVELMHRRSVRPGALSGGEQQQLAIARALANEPFVLLADEPTANLDPETTDLVVRILADVQARGTTVLVATHNEALMSGRRQRVLRLEDGRIAGGGVSRTQPGCAF